MTDEELEKMLSFVKLSENLTDATNRNIDEIAELVYMKFEVNLEDYDFASQFDELEKEVTDAIKEIKTKYGGSPFLTETIRNAMASDNELYLYVENTVKTKKLVGQIKEDYDFDDENLEFASKIGELIYRIICMRARKDIIPLIHRGAYSEDIKNALIFWRNN